MSDISFFLFSRYHYDGEFEFRSPEDQLLHFLNRTRQQEPPWRWIDAKQRSQPPEKSNTSSKTSSKSGTVLTTISLISKSIQIQEKKNK